MKLRIHHFLDMLRDYGVNIEMRSQKYGHSYHFIAEQLYSNQMDLYENEKIRFRTLPEMADLYINEMDWLYKENAPEHTFKKRDFVLKAVLKKRSELDEL